MLNWWLNFANSCDHFRVEYVIAIARSPGLIGSGSGPDGLRSDFLKGLIDLGEDSSLVPLLIEFVQKIIDGQIPHAL